MKYLKRFILPILLISLSLSLAGCGSRQLKEDIEAFDNLYNYYIDVCQEYDKLLTVPYREFGATEFINVEGEPAYPLLEAIDNANAEWEKIQSDEFADAKDAFRMGLDDVTFAYGAYYDYCSGMVAVESMPFDPVGTKNAINGYKQAFLNFKEYDQRFRNDINYIEEAYYELSEQGIIDAIED